MKKFFSFLCKIIFFPFVLIEYFVIYFYKYCISPFLPHVCRFYPSCSTYFLKAVKEYGFFKGTLLGFKRVIKCNPWSKGGYDELKPNIKGKIKWIL